jgi:hypothetical protein
MIFLMVFKMQNYMKVMRFPSACNEKCFFYRGKLQIILEFLNEKTISCNEKKHMNCYHTFHRATSYEQC